MTTKTPSLSTDLSLPEVLKEAAVQRCSENMPHVYRRTPMLKRDFNKVALLLYWNRTSAWVFSCKFAIYFQNNFPKNTYARLLLYSLSTSATITVTQPKMNLNICYGITCYNKRWNMLQLPFLAYTAVTVIIKETAAANIIFHTIPLTFFYRQFWFMIGSNSVVEICYFINQRH